MKKLALLFACVSGMTLTSLASAATLNIAGVSGVRSQSNTSCSDPNIPTGEMYVTFGSTCVVSYPLNLPVGTTLDSIQVAYNVESLNFGPPNITAYLAQNRISPNLGAIAIAGNTANPAVVGQGFLNMSTPNITIAAGSIYWMQITDHSVSEISSVSVTYH